MATVRDASLIGTDLDPITLKTMDAFRRRRSLLLLLRAIGIGVLVFVMFTLILATLDYLFFVPDGLRWCGSLLVWIATVVVAWKTGIQSSKENDSLNLAKNVESAAPELREDLLSAVELADPQSANGSSYFRSLLQNRVARRMSKLEIGRLLPFKLVQRWVLSGGLVIAFCVAMSFIPSAQFGRRFARAALPGLAIERASRTKVEILQPSPTSGYVAERDAIGVVAMISGAAPDDAMLQWRSEDGDSGETPMTARFDSSTFMPGGRMSGDSQSAGPDSVTDVSSQDASQRFAANLSVGSVPIEYRIIAGDAITLWHELIPLPRPRVTRYEKLYKLPQYARLSDRVADEEHGDLKALQGTVAELIVTFDQPVETPLLRFGFGGTTMEMKPVEESSERFTANVSIKTSGQYQVDAVSVQSGLNNPFSPSHTINPVLDTLPRVRWDADIEDSKLVSSLDVINLSGIAVDDLPLDRVFQEFQVNGGPLQEVAVATGDPSREFNLDWDWDLMSRLGDSETTSKLSTGDLVKTRLVAIDRRGARAESRMIELLIADDGFNADRHTFLHEMAARNNQIAIWAEKIESMSESMSAATLGKQPMKIGDWTEAWKPLQAESVQLVQRINEALGENANPASAAVLELMGGGILDVETRLDGPLKRFQWLEQQREAFGNNNANRHLKELASEFKAVRYQADRLGQLARWQLALGLSAAMYSDVRGFLSSMDRLLEKTPLNRMPRYITLVAGRLKEVDRLVEQYESILPARTAQHLSGEHWLKWSQRSSTQLQSLIEDDARPDQMVAVLRAIQEQTVVKPQHVIDSSATNEVIRYARDMRQEMFYLSDLTRELRDAGNRLQQQLDRTGREKGADQAAQLNLEVDWHQQVWRDRLSRLKVRAAGQEKLNRSKSKVDLQYAADQNLFSRAIRNVTENGFKKYRDEPADTVLHSIGDAISQLQAASDLASVRDSLLAIAEGERQPDGAPLRKVYHPTWFALQPSITERATRAMKDARFDWDQEIEPVDQTRFNDDQQQTQRRLDQRRWKNDPFLSVTQSLSKNARVLAFTRQKLSPRWESARKTLRKYVLSISEQAREAAEAAERAEAEANQRDEEELQLEHEDAMEKATETIQSLIDRANTTQITSAQEREVARDADAAAELIAQAVRQAKETLQKVDASVDPQDRDARLAQTEEKLGTLADQLEKTAEHFEKIENGEDISESRQDLRQAEQQLQDQRELQERYEEAEKMANAANQDPRQLLEQLERELKGNEEMQEALSDISGDLIEDAANRLDQAAEKEQELNRRLESDDAKFSEQKRQRQLMLEEFSMRAQTLRERTLRAARDAADMAQDRDARDALDKVREKLNDSIQRTNRALDDKSSLDEVQQAMNDLQQAVEKTARESLDIADNMQEKAKAPVFKEKRQRDSVARRMESRANQMRNDEVTSLDQQRKRWMNHEKNAGNRVRNADKKKRDAERAADLARKRLEKIPDTRERDQQKLAEEIERQEERAEQAESSSEEARKTSELARQRRDEAVQRSKDINKKKTEKLKQPNPAAELSAQAARDASERAEVLARELQRLGAKSDIAEEMNATSESAKSLANEQQTIEQDVQDTVDELARSARHEARLENPKLAQALDEAATKTQNDSGQAAKDATERLEQTIEQGEKSSQAGQSLKQASKTMSGQAQELREMLGQMTSNDGPSDATAESQQPASADPGQSPSQDQSQTQPMQRSNSGQPESSSAKSSGMQSGNQQDGSPQNSGMQAPSQQQDGQPKDARQMAQTLDELDRSLAAQGQQKPGESDETNQPNQGNEQSGSQGQNSTQGKPSSQGEPNSDGQPSSGSQTAMQASPTLAQMLERQMQQAAQERMKSLQEAQQGEQGKNPSDRGSQNPQSESGQGEPPGGDGTVKLLEGDILDGQWGDLRRRGVDDAAQGRGSRNARGYGKEVEAYFRALSKRSAGTNQKEPSLPSRGTSR